MRKLACLVLLMAAAAWAQSTPPIGFGEQPATSFATQLSQCPTVSVGYFACIVIDPTGTNQPYMALSVAGFNGGAPFPILSQGPAGPQGNPGQTPVFNAQATQLDPSALPTASVTGSAPNFLLNFGIPAGQTGQTGPQGLQGQQGIPGIVPIGQPFTLNCKGEAGHTIPSGFQTSCVIVSIP